jgi:hypothetical protein
MLVNEWMNDEYSDEGTHTQNTRNSSTRSPVRSEENRPRNRSKKCMCKRAFILISESVFCKISPYKIDALTYLYIPWFFVRCPWIGFIAVWNRVRLCPLIVVIAWSLGCYSCHCGELSQINLKPRADFPCVSRCPRAGIKIYPCQSCMARSVTGGIIWWRRDCTIGYFTTCHS